MALGHNPSIVTSNLILCVDAGSPRSYSGSGTSWLDVSGSNYTSTLTNGPVYTNANAASYFTFDGVNDFSISMGLQTFGNSMTWEAWIYATGNANPYNMFMGRYLPYFGFYGGNSLYFSNYINSVQQTIQTASTLSLNTWYHAAFTTSYSAPNTTMTIYTNGVQSTSASYSGTQNNFAGYGFMIGDGNNGSNLSWYPFTGRIGNVKVYDKALSATEILQNFNALRGRYGI